MEQTEKIQFKVSRDMGQVFNVAFAFLRQNFGLFLKCMLFVVGPFLLISSIATGLMYSGMFSGIFDPNALSPEDIFSNYVSIEFLLIIIGSFLTYVFWVGTMVHFLDQYNQFGKNGFTVDQLWRVILKDAGRIIVTMIGFGFIITLLVIVFALFIGLFAAVSGVLAGILVFLFLIAMLLIGPVSVQYSFSLFIVRLVERRDFTSSLSRTWQLIKGQYWWTWLINFCTYLMGYFAMYIFLIPMYVIIAFVSFNSATGNSSGEDYGIWISAGMAIAMFLGSLVWSVPMLILSFHHYSLVEKKDGTGMFEMIDQIGNKPTEEDELQY